MATELDFTSVGFADQGMQSVPLVRGGLFSRSPWVGRGQGGRLRLRLPVPVA
jgi:hypothetical protein